MRYPIWLFLFVVMLPPFAAHAMLTGGAQIKPTQSRIVVSMHVPSLGFAIAPGRADIVVASRSVVASRP